LIYVTVGAHYQPFTRLVAKMDEIAHELEEEVVIQRGATCYTPRYARWSDYVTQSTAERFIQESRLVVSHAGIGTIILALQSGTPIVIVPRLKKYDEHIDDHQLEIAAALEDRPGVRVVYDLAKLNEALIHSERPRPSPNREDLIRAVREFIDGIG